MIPLPDCSKTKSTDPGNLHGFLMSNYWMFALSYPVEVHHSTAGVAVIILFCVFHRDGRMIPFKIKPCWNRGYSFICCPESRDQIHSLLE